jgi:serine/threonine protein kinase
MVAGALLRNTDAMENMSSAKSPDLLEQRFELRELIGEGAMGSVFRAFDLVLSRDVAVKILNLDNAAEPVRQRFLREARALALLDHPNIVTIYGSGESPEGRLFHVMELADGKTLAEELESGPLTADRFLEVFEGVLSGLAHAHENRIAHRDLKPGNIVQGTDAEGQRIYKIIDFGIARMDLPAGECGPTLTRAGAVAGSPAYMSPEQCRGLRGDFLSDIYSLGCIMYECIRGMPPFSAGTALEVMCAHMNELPPTLLRNCKSAESERLCGLVSRCLEKDALRRPQSVAEIAREIADLFSSSKRGKLDLFGARLPPLPGRLKLTAIWATVLLLPVCLIVFWQASLPAGNWQALPKGAVQGRIETLKARENKNFKDWLELGLSQLKSSACKDWADAEKTFLQALELCPLNGRYASERSACFALKAKAELQQNKLKDAAADFDEAVKTATDLHPDQEMLEDILLERMMLCLRCRNFDGALADLNRIKLGRLKPEAPMERFASFECYQQKLDRRGDARPGLVDRGSQELSRMGPQSYSEAEQMLVLSEALALRLHRVDFSSGEKPMHILSEKLRAALSDHGSSGKQMR